VPPPLRPFSHPTFCSVSISTPRGRPVQAMSWVQHHRGATFSCWYTCITNKPDQKMRHFYSNILLISWSLISVKWDSLKQTVSTYRLKAEICSHMGSVSFMLLCSSHHSYCVLALKPKTLQHARHVLYHWTTSTALDGVFLCCFVMLGLELRAYTLSHSTSLFLWWVEIGSRKLFAQAGFELISLLISAS
jgi:hypothetical protein